MLVRLRKKQKKALTNTKDVHLFVWNIIRRKPPFDRQKEHVYVIGMSRSQQIIYVDWVSMGTVHGTVAEPREIFRMAILKGVSSIIMVHNHPSNNPKPSKQDLVVTEQVVAAGKIIGIQVLDHVIICESGHYSFYLDGKIGEEVE